MKTSIAIAAAMLFLLAACSDSQTSTGAYESTAAVPYEKTETPALIDFQCRGWMTRWRDEIKSYPDMRSLNIRDWSYETHGSHRCDISFTSNKEDGQPCYLSARILDESLGTTIYVSDFKNIGTNACRFTSTGFF